MGATQLLNPSSSQPPPRRMAVLSCIVCFTVLTIVGQLLVSAYQRGAFQPWSQLQLPPGLPRHIRIGTQGTLLLEMADGRVFEWNERSWNERPSEAEEPATSNSVGRVYGFWYSCRPGVNDYYLTPPAPQQVIERVAEWCSGPDAGVYYEFVLLQNEQVWYWGHGVHVRQELIYFVFVRMPLCGGILVTSVVVGLVVYALRHRRATTA